VVAATQEARALRRTNAQLNGLWTYDTPRVVG